MLEDLHWSPAKFDAVCRPDAAGRADAIVEFPSPFAGCGIGSDIATMSWYAARDRSGSLTTGPAMVVLDIIHAGNLVAGYVARQFAKNGIHGFVVDLPHSRSRRGDREKDCATLFRGTRQAIADARRARDVVAALPHVDGRIGIQGTSFGGFVATMASALDGAFDLSCLALCGGDMEKIINDGRGEASKLRQKLHVAGLRDPAAIHDLLWQIEPMRLAHRLDPQRTWLWSARRDQVVPATCSRALASAIGLSARHHQQLSGCHYTCALAAPWWVSLVTDTVKQAWGMHNRNTLQNRSQSLEWAA